MRELRSVCVYCGSSPGFDPAHREAAEAVGRLLAAEGIQLVYGGGAVGLMGAVADACLAAGGEVIGVLPRGLFTREVAQTGLTELIEVSSMHERKLTMFERSEAFVALPGGLGTLEELAEMTTWSQIGVHDRPVAVLDVKGYWSPLRRWLTEAVAAGFMRAEHLELMTFVDDIDELLPTLRTHRVPHLEKWLEPGEM